MGDQRVGTCSLCGGDVTGFRGSWSSITPPPPDKCTSCGAVSAADVIPMVRPGTLRKPSHPYDAGKPRWRDND